MKDWLEELQESQRNIEHVQYGLEQIADGLALAGIGEELRGRLRRYSYMLHETNLAVHRGTSGAVTELYDTARYGTLNMLGAVLAMCESVEEEDGQNQET